VIPNRLLIICWMFACSAALSAALGVPVPPRAFMMLSSIGAVKRGPRTRSCPKRLTM